MNYKPLLGLAAVAFCTHAAAQITFYESDHFRGRTFATSQPVSNFKQRRLQRPGVVGRGRARAVGSLRRLRSTAAAASCCVAAAPDPLRNLGLENRISSVRPAPRDKHYEHEPQPVLDTPYEYRRRPNERLSRAPVTSVRAVVGPPEQRCWVERQQVAEPQRRFTCPGR